jgi:GSH-dependent disulfide-bond oxidoreductase
VKVTIMLEELLSFGHRDAEYDAWLIKIGEGDQFGSGFVGINSNSKIPALVGRGGPTPWPMRPMVPARDFDASK